jgi:hypothetical protein
MAQLFSSASNTVAPGVLAGFVLMLLFLAGGVWMVFQSPYATAVGIPLEQPVPFSHEHHVSGLGIDCRYCHTGVETASFAGVPSTQTCMTCHSQVWTEAPLLAPVRESLITNEPIRWNRANRVPDYVYFNHSVHVAKGVSCVSCHGRVDQMPLVSKAHTLYMRWCLECHTHPAGILRDRSEVFDMASKNPTREVGEQRLEAHRVRTVNLLDCSACHR